MSANDDLITAIFTPRADNPDVFKHAGHRVYLLKIDDTGDEPQWRVRCEADSRFLDAFPDELTQRTDGVTSYTDRNDVVHEVEEVEVVVVTRVRMIVPTAGRETRSHKIAAEVVDAIEHHAVRLTDFEEVDDVLVCTSTPETLSIQVEATGQVWLNPDRIRDLTEGYAAETFG